MTQAVTPTNVRRSVLKHLESQFSGENVDWPDVDTDTESWESWMQVRLLGFSASPARKNSHREEWTLDVNCFARVGREDVQNIHRHWELAKLVRTAVNQETIEMKDWDTAGDPVTDYLRFQESEITPVPRQGARPVDTQDLAQLNVSTPFHLMN